MDSEVRSDQPAQSAPQVIYTWKPWWGGEAVASTTPPMIANAGAELRRRIGGLKAEKKQGVTYAVKSAKDLMDKLRDALDELGYNAPIVELQGGAMDVERGTQAFLIATVEVQCPDGSCARMRGAGHGCDSQDKAGGKASTYAWKDALVKGFSLPDKEMVDTDDEEKPIKGGPKKAAKGTKAKGGAPTEEPKAEATDDATDGFDKAKWEREIEKLKSKASAKLLAATMRVQLKPEQIKEISPAFAEKVKGLPE